MEKVRPNLPKSLVEGHIKEEELFQNMVLRPVIKMQHDILILRVQSHFLSKKIVFHMMDKKKRVNAIESAFQNDDLPRLAVRGIAAIAAACAGRTRCRHPNLWFS